MNEIKITVTYDKPITSRIDTLFAEYDAAHKLAEATKEELAPIIDAVGEAKHQAILVQLEPIIDGVKKLHKLRQQIYGDTVHMTPIYASYNCYNGTRYFVIEYSDFSKCRIDISFCKMSIDSSSGFDFVTINRKYGWNYFGAKDGIITNWNKLNIIEGLQKSLESQIKDMIRAVNRNRETIQANFNAIMSD